MSRFYIILKFFGNVVNENSFLRKAYFCFSQVALGLRYTHTVIARHASPEAIPPYIVIARQEVPKQSFFSRKRSPPFDRLRAGAGACDDVLAQS